MFMLLNVTGGVYAAKQNRSLVVLDKIDQEPLSLVFSLLKCYHANITLYRFALKKNLSGASISNSGQFLFAYFEPQKDIGIDFQQQNNSTPFFPLKSFKSKMSYF